MTDLEISKALALAIGWKRSDIMECNWPPFLQVWFDGDWRDFDYTDWNVIGPIAARYDAFPTKTSSGTGWANIAFETRNPTDVREATPQKAIAMAVIEGAKK